MQKSRIFSKLKFAIFIVPFYSAIMCINDAMAIDIVDPTCPQCYYWNGTKCVYDGHTNCYIDPVDPPIAPEQCQGNAVLNEETGECECNMRGNDFCSEPWSYFNYSNNVCTCVQMSCPSGQYAKGLNNCEQCPDPGLIATNGKCNVESDVSKSNLVGGMVNMIADYNGCYLPADCSATDETGTFVLAGDCRHEVAQEIFEKPVS